MGRNTRRYLAPGRRVSISRTMKPTATIAAFKFNISAKSAAALRNSRKELIRPSANPFNQEPGIPAQIPKVVASMRVAGKCLSWPAPSCAKVGERLTGSCCIGAEG